MPASSPTHPSEQRLLVFHRLRFLDVAVTVVFLLVACLGIHKGYHAISEVSSSASVILSTQQGPIATASLSEPGPLPTRLGGLHIDHEIGRIRVSEAECHQQICVKRGWISKPGETIICIPNHVLIEIVGQENPDHVDAISQ
jgi:hypothetical protein